MNNIPSSLEVLAAEALVKAGEDVNDLPDSVKFAVQTKAIESAALNNPKFMSNSEIIQRLKNDPKSFWNEKQEKYYKERYNKNGNVNYVMRFLMLLTNTVKRDFINNGRFARTAKSKADNIDWLNILGTFLVNDLPDEMMINLYYNSQDNRLLISRDSEFSDEEKRDILQTELWTYEEYEKLGKEKFILEFLICLSNNQSRNYTKVESKPDVEMIPSSYDVREHLKTLWTTIIHHTLDDLAKGTSEKKAPRCDQDIRLWGDKFGGELPELSKVSPGRKLLINLYNNTFFDVAEGGLVPGTELKLLGISTISKPKFFVDGVSAERSGKPRSKRRRKTRRKRKRRKLTRRRRK